MSNFQEAARALKALADEQPTGEFLKVPAGVWKECGAALKGVDGDQAAGVRQGAANCPPTGVVIVQRVDLLFVVSQLRGHGTPPPVAAANAGEGKPGK